MKVEAIVAGIIMVFLGLGLYYVGEYPEIIGLDIDGNYLRSAGMFIAVAGVIFSFVGFILEKKQFFPQPYQQSYPYPPQHPKQEQYQQTTQQLQQIDKIKHCDECNRHVLIDFTFCPYCGYKQPTQQLDSMHCNNCKRQVASDFIYCPYCSQSLISGSGEVTDRNNDKVELE